MRTSVLYRQKGGQRAYRAYLPKDWPNGDMRPPFPVLAFVPAHVNPSTGKKVTDSAQLPLDGFPLENGETRQARVIPTEWIDKLDEIDREISALEEHRRRVVAAAWPHGRPLGADDIR